MVESPNRTPKNFLSCSMKFLIDIEENNRLLWLADIFEGRGSIIVSECVFKFIKRFIQSLKVSIIVCSTIELGFYISSFVWVSK